MCNKIITVLKDLVKETFGTDFMVTYSDVITSVVRDTNRVIEALGGYNVRDYGELSLIPGQLVSFTSFVAKQVALYMKAKAFNMKNLERAYELAFHRDNNELVMYLNMESVADYVSTIGLEVYKPSVQGTMKVYDNGEGIHVEGGVLTWMMLPNHVVAELPDYEMVCVRLLQAFTRKALQVSNLNTKVEFVTDYPLKKGELTYSIPFSFKGDLHNKSYDMMYDLMCTISDSYDVLTIFNINGISNTVYRFMLLVTSVLDDENLSVFPHIYRAIVD